MAVLSIRASDVQRTYERSLNLLNTRVKTIGDRVGWHQYIEGNDANRVGNVATAQGIVTMCLLDYASPALPKFLRTLREGQNNDGGWILLSSMGTSTVEATTCAILGLLAGGEAQDSQLITRGKEWLKNNQNDDGGWGPHKGLDSRIYITFLACRCLTQLEPQLGRNRAPLRPALNWVVECQNDDGGWGERPQRKSTVVHTAFALLTLKLLGMNSADTEIRKGVRYLYEHWHPQRMWEGVLSSEIYEISATSNPALARVTIEYFPTTWAVLALLAVGESAFREQIFASVVWLLHSQNADGTWSIENITPNRLWAVHDAIQAITTFMRKLATSQTMDRLILLDDVLVASSATKKTALFSQLLLSAVALLAIGILIGVGLAGLNLITGFSSAFGVLLTKYWAWLVLAIFVLAAYPLIKFRVIGRKEAVFIIIFPVMLVIIQLFLTLH